MRNDKGQPQKESSGTSSKETLEDLLARRAAGGAGKFAAPAARIESASGAGEQARDARWIDIDILDDNPYQPPGRAARKKAVADIIESFDRDGQMQPGLARPHPSQPGRYQLAFGHRRKGAVHFGANAGLRQPEPQRFIGKLMVIVRENLSDLDMLRYATVENAVRKDFSALELAQNYVTMRELTTEKLRGEGHTFRPNPDGSPGLASWRMVAQENGYSETKFADLQRIAGLLDLPAWAQAEFKPDDSDPEKFVFNSRHGRALERVAHDERQLRTLVNLIKRHRLSGAEAERRVEEIRVAQPSLRDLKIRAAMPAAMAAADEAKRRASLVRQATERVAGVPNPLRAVCGFEGRGMRDEPSGGATPGDTAENGDAADGEGIPSSPIPHPSSLETTDRPKHDSLVVAGDALKTAMEELTRYRVTPDNAPYTRTTARFLVNYATEIAAEVDRIVKAAQKLNEEK